MKRLFLCVVSLLIVGGCDNTKKALGLKKAIPDEHTLMERPPLTTPKDLYSLHPPQSGDPEDSYRKLRSGKSGKLEGASKLSAAERSLLKKADAAEADSKIREKLGESDNK